MTGQRTHNPYVNPTMVYYSPFTTDLWGGRRALLSRHARMSQAALSAMVRRLARERDFAERIFPIKNAHRIVAGLHFEVAA